jgi:hypothetical protein
VLRREVAHDRVRFVEDEAVVLDHRHEAVRDSSRGTRACRCGRKLPPASMRS